MPRLWPRARGIAEEPGAHLRMPWLRSSDVDHGWHGDAPVQIAADSVVLGRASHGNPLERHVGTPVSIEAFVRANVKPGTTLLTDGHRSYPGLTRLPTRPADGRQDGGSCGPATDSPGLLADEALGARHLSRAAPQARRHPTSTNWSSDTIGAFTGTSPSRPCSGSPRTITRRATGISSAATILAKACRQSGASRDAEGQRQACSRMGQASLKSPAPALLQTCLSSNAKCGETWDNGISLRYASLPIDLKVIYCSPSPSTNKII